MMLHSKNLKGVVATANKLSKFDLLAKSNSREVTIGKWVVRLVNAL